MNLADSAQNGEIAKTEFAERQPWILPTHMAKELAVIVAPDDPFSRTVFAITSQLQHMYVDSGTRSIGFIGDVEGTGTTVVAANVAAAFAIGGMRTILIETNFRSPRIAEMFGLDPSRSGLSEWMAGIGDVNSWSTYMRPAFPGLMVMPAGGALKEGEALKATELRRMIIELSRMFDIVVCDSAPMSDMSGMLAMVSTVERTIIVAKANSTRVKTLVKFQDILKQCGGQLGGTVYMDF
jgi:protein-tyrosine kinase